MRARLKVCLAEPMAVTGICYYYDNSPTITTTLQYTMALFAFRHKHTSRCSQGTNTARISCYNGVSQPLLNGPVLSLISGSIPAESDERPERARRDNELQRAELELDKKKRAELHNPQDYMYIVRAHGDFTKETSLSVTRRAHSNPTPIVIPSLLLAVCLRFEACNTCVKLFC